MTTDDLKKIGSEFNNIDLIREQIFTPKLVQLHTSNKAMYESARIKVAITDLEALKKEDDIKNKEIRKELGENFTDSNLIFSDYTPFEKVINEPKNFISPETFGVYKSTGGYPLGVVGSTFKPMDLNTMLDSIIHSAIKCGGVDISTLKFNEYKGGSKVAFTLDLPTKKIEGSPMVGDIMARKIEFRTGFDGKTKSSVVESFERLWCENGCTNTISQNVAFKNTINNHAKIYNLCQYIEQSVQNSDDFVTNIGRLSEIKIDQIEIDNFLTKLTGYDVKGFKDLSTRQKNILNSINAAIGIEKANTGATMFSLVNGITRYTTHDLSKGSEESLFYDASAKMNVNALNLAFAELV